MCTQGPSCRWDIGYCSRCACLAARHCQVMQQHLGSLPACRRTATMPVTALGVRAPAALSDGLSNRRAASRLLSCKRLRARGWRCQCTASSAAEERRGWVRTAHLLALSRHRLSRRLPFTSFSEKLTLHACACLQAAGVQALRQPLLGGVAAVAAALLCTAQPASADLLVPTWSSVAAQKSAELGCVRQGCDQRSCVATACVAAACLC